MSSSLAYWKREKNFKALEKGYTRDPEGFPIRFLFERLQDEIKELETAIMSTAEDVMDPFFVHTDIVKECADISNLVDYIHAKATSRYPTKYQPNNSISSKELRRGG